MPILQRKKVSHKEADYVGQVNPIARRLISGLSSYAQPLLSLEDCGFP